MRNYLVWIVVLLFMGCLITNAQTPQSIPYQAVARDVAGNLLVNKTVCVQFRVYNQLSGGTLLYEEHNTITTNALGLFTLNVGQGTYDGGSFANFNSITWGTTSTYMEVGLDLTGNCSGYVTMGRTQMMSVPYALYAGSAGSAGGSAGGDLTGSYPNPNIAANKVTYADIQKENNATLLGNNSGGTASPSEITLGTGLGFNGANQIINTSPSSGGTITSIATSTPLTGGPISGTGTIGINQASGSTNGYLSSADWNTFNSKEAALTFSYPLSNSSNTIGFASQSANTVFAGPSSGGATTPAFRPLVTADLPTSGVTAGTYNTVTVNTQGQVTSAANTSYEVSIPGEVKAIAFSTIPTGWLACDGSAVSRTTYAALFAAVGTTWGAGDGSTTFNLPDFRDMVLVGTSPGSLTGSRTTARTLGQTGGEESHTQLVTEMPAHSHTITDPGHAHSITDPGHTHGIAAATVPITITDPGHSHGVTLNGNIIAQNPSTILSGGFDGAGMNAGNYDNTGNGGVTVKSATTGITASGNYPATNTASATTGITVKSATTGITVNNTGGGSAFNVMQPFAVIQWIIKE